MSDLNYTNAEEKMEFIRLCTLRGDAVPASHVRMLAETLQHVFRVLDNVMQTPELLTIDLIISLRVLMERQLLPFIQDVPQSEVWFDEAARNQATN